MPAIVVNDIYQVNLVCRDASATQFSENVHHMLCTAVAGAPTLDSDLAKFADAFYSPTLIAILNNKAEYWGVRVQRVSPRPPTLPSINTASRGLGAIAGDQLPPQTAGLVTLQTALAGRKFRGRKYFPFGPEGNSDPNGHPDAPYQVLLGAMGIKYVGSQVVNNIGASGSVTMQHVIWHRALNTVDPIVQFTVRSQWATQRRRSDINKSDSPPFA